MIKLDPDLVDYLKKVMKTAQLLKFENVVVQKEYVRGCNETRTAVMLDSNVPELPFEGVGIGGVGKLLSRMNLMETYTAEAELVNGFVMNLAFKTKGAAIKYKCGNPRAIKSPTKYKDEDVWSFEISKEAVTQLTKAATAMQSLYVQVTSKEGDCTFTLMDSDKNTYVQEFNGYVDNVAGDENLSFDFHYDTAMFLTTLKHADDRKDVEGPEGSLKFNVASRGALVAKINTIEIGVAPIPVL